MAGSNSNSLVNHVNIAENATPSRRNGKPPGYRDIDYPKFIIILCSSIIFLKLFSA